MVYLHISDTYNMYFIIVCISINKNSNLKLNE